MLLVETIIFPIYSDPKLLTFGLSLKAHRAALTASLWNIFI